LHFVCTFEGLITEGNCRLFSTLLLYNQGMSQPTAADDDAQSQDKHLEAAQVLQIARFAQRASLEEVAGGILEWTEQNHPDAAEQTATEIDAFFAELPAPAATPAAEFIAELRAALPPRWANKAETIWRAYASSGTTTCTRSTAGRNEVY
jgi:hypothetical protein